MRERLPHRRLGASKTFIHAGHAWTISCGFNDRGHVREVFLHGARYGSHLAVQADDLCVMLSYLLQHGPRVADCLRALTDRSAGEIVAALQTYRADETISLHQAALAFADLIEAIEGPPAATLAQLVAETQGAGGNA